MTTDRDIVSIAYLPVSLSSGKKRPLSEVDEGDATRSPAGRHNRRRLDDLSAGPEAGESSTHLSYPPTNRVAPPVPLQQPSTLLTFSYTPERVLEFNDSALRYYADPPPKANLKYGYERWIKRPEEKGRLDGLLRAVSKYRSRLDASGADGGTWLKDMSVVSWRGVMTKILTSPYENRDGWDLNVMMIGGTMYFEEHLSEEKLVAKEDMTPQHRLFSYYGYSFESYCTSTVPNIREPVDESSRHPFGWGGDVDTNVQWCNVVKTKLGSDRLIIGGEVDCVRDRFTGKTDSLVELKTSLLIRGPQDEAKFEKKLLKFYFQSFLLGVPEIVVGFRTPQGQVNTIQSFKTMQIPRLVRGKPGAWEPSLCLDWGHRFLHFLKENIAARPDKSVRSVWRAKFSPVTGVSVMLLGDEEVEEVEAGEDRVGFIPSWYFDEAALSERSKSPVVEVDHARAAEEHIQHSPAKPPTPPVTKVPSGWQI